VNEPFIFLLFVLFLSIFVGWIVVGCCVFVVLCGLLRVGFWFVGLFVSSVGRRLGVCGLFLLVGS